MHALPWFVKQGQAGGRRRLPLSRRAAAPWLRSGTQQPCCAQPPPCTPFACSPTAPALRHSPSSSPAADALDAGDNSTLADLRTQFLSLDANADGQLSPAEFDAELAGYLPYGSNSTDIAPVSA